MSGLPRLTGRALIAALVKAGFQIARVRGSHHILKHVDGRMTVVPVHAGDTIGPGLMAKILRDCRISQDELRKLL
jgi:predicted RNA binding protein YcfA (HicA-like mRNA interferase family)